ncbi:MAG: glycosyltransferase [Planctomycetota bacterium]|nr:MAG: glycosyltransferase [Planctomycetota bacterium]
MDNTPLVSVIIAVRNGERFLASAINSVLAQDYRPLEIIVVDGRSTDKTAQIAQSFSRVRYIEQQERGIPDAYNIGIDAAQGELIAFLSHDDRWTPDKLSVQVKYITEHPEIQYTVARMKFFLEQDQPTPSGFRPELLQDDHVGRVMETLVVRKSLFAKIGLFRTDLSTAEDVEWFARANDHGIKMAIIPKVLLYKRVHDSNSSLTLENNRNLLKALRHSVQRKRTDSSSGSRSAHQ